ncbi:MAG: hypothetical protein R3298_08890, partial [Gammaproteobacteria bacterium]|nr:hypothetical protein [Gammaproteobacteria bacterium]
MHEFRILFPAALVLALALGAGPLLAAPPSWAGKDKGGNQGGGQDGGPEVNVEISLGGYFDDRTRHAVRSHYAEQARGGHCPPGLAKKNN